MKETTRNFHRHKRPAGNRQRPIVTVFLRLSLTMALPLLLLAACVSPSERKQYMIKPGYRNHPYKNENCLEYWADQYGYLTP